MPWAWPATASVAVAVAVSSSGAGAFPVPTLNRYNAVTDVPSVNVTWYATV